MSARKNRRRGAVLTLPSNNDERWTTFFLDSQPNAYFETMARRMALDNLNRDEILAQRVPQLDINAIQDKFEQIRARLQLDHYHSHWKNKTLEDNLQFSRDVCELKTLMQGLQIPPANSDTELLNPHTHGVIPDVTISAMRSEIGRTLGHLQEITAFVKGERIREGEEEYDDIKGEWDDFEQTNREWLRGFRRRASCNPENLRAPIQDEFVLGTFDLLESYTERNSSWWKRLLTWLVKKIPFTGDYIVWWNNTWSNNIWL